MATSLIRYLLFLFCLTVNWQELGPQNALAPIFVDSLEVKVLKSNNTSHDFKEVFGNLNSFLPKESFTEKTHPNETYWILVDFEHILKTIQQNRVGYLKFTSFDYGTMFSLQNGTIKKSPIGQFDSNTVSKKKQCFKLSFRSSFPD